MPSDAPRAPDAQRGPDALRSPGSIDIDVPDGATPAVCPYCDRPFASARLRTLHLEQTHRGALSPAERERVAAATAAEADRLRRFRLRVLAGIVLLYFGLLFTYAVVT